MLEIFINKESTNFNKTKNQLSFFNFKIVYDKYEKIKKISFSKSEKYLIYGKINHIYDFKKKQTRTFSNILFKKLIKLKKFNEINELIDGRYFIIQIINHKVSHIITDKYCKIDLFYNLSGNKIYISNSIKNFQLKKWKENLNDISLANALMNYGSYVPKPFTLYKKINRFNISEYLHITGTKIKIKKIKRNFLNINNKFNTYENFYKTKFKSFFINSIKTRLSKRMNWVYISSGFDSTSILATLNHLLDNKKITAIIAQVKYSNKYGICNKFEIERTKKICKYFKIPLKIIKVDYSKSSILTKLTEVKEKFKHKHIFSFNTINFFELAKYIKKKGKTEDRVFNGDISDGVQNFGFSQFATILNHPSLSFREYADKMFCYLYSPSFFKVIEKKDQLKDKIFNFLVKEKKIHFDKNIFTRLNKNEYLFRFISPLFLSPSRFPFSDIYNDKLLRKDFSKKYSKHMYRNYFKNIVINLKKENLYSSILYLYNMFHWSSGPVQGSLRSSEVLGIKSSTPFWDSNLQKYFSEMPENWGRGLEIRKTKHVLKNYLKNDIDYPTWLQAGPHSYIYDVDPKWNADLDILYHSYLRKTFLKIFKEANLKKIFNPKSFNINYIEFIKKKYVQNEYLYGSDLLILKNITIILYYLS